MKLLRDTILSACDPMYDKYIREQSRYDRAACRVIAGASKIVVFATDQLMALRPLIEKDAGILADYRLPFAHMIVQFTRPVPEHQFMVGARSDGIDAGMTWDPYRDTIDALILSQVEDADGRLVNNAIAYYRSGSINRVLWYNGERVDGGNITPGEHVGGDHLADKNTIRGMAAVIVSFINCDNILLERQDPPERVNRKRRRRGKKEIEPYYRCRIKPPSGTSARSTGQSAGHGYRYDVRGHIRRLRNGKTTWVHAHQRGLDHLEYRPKTYVVGRDEK